MSKKPMQFYYHEDELPMIERDLPKVIERANAEFMKSTQPNWDTRMKVLDIIKKYIKENNRIVYGGTAINELIKAQNAADSIYKPYQFADIEFYSPEPRVDIVNLANILYEKGYEYVQAKAAQHDETYTLFADTLTYCDVSYMPKRIMGGTRYEEINGIKYAHPHFIMIDMLRIFNQPLTAADQRWEKTFKRFYKLQKYYPFPKIRGTIQTFSPDKDISDIIDSIKKQFFSKYKPQMLISDYDAYNTVIRYIKGHKAVVSNKKAVSILDSFICQTPYLGLVSTDYATDVRNLYAFIKSKVDNPQDLSIVEYWPLFQFTGFSVDIKYKDRTIAKVTQADGFCVPSIETSNAYSYVSYQYILMVMMIKRFAAYLDWKENDTEKKSFGVAISNLLMARSIFLDLSKESPINNTPITDFKVSCIGETMDFRRASFIRNNKLYFEKGKRPFDYKPSHYLNKPEEERKAFDPASFNHRNSSGNIIKRDHFKWFPLDSSNDIIQVNPEADNTDEEQE